MRASTALVAILLWVGSAGATSIDPITPHYATARLYLEAIAGRDVEIAEFNDHTGQDPFGPLNVSGSVTAGNDDAYVTTSGTITATFDDATHGQVSFVRHGWETFDVESGRASLAFQTFWHYQFTSNGFGYFRVHAVLTREGTSVDGVDGFGVFDGAPHDDPADGLVSLIFPECQPFPCDEIVFDASLRLIKDRTYNFMIFDYLGVPGSLFPGTVPLGTRTSFANGAFTWHIDILNLAPEPGTLGLLGVGLLGLGLTRRRRAS